MSRVTIKVDAVADACGPEEAAQLLGKGVATIWRWIRDGKILAVRIGGRTLIPNQEIKRLKNHDLAEPGNG
ncbi:MAG: helix-turn-helix domain-containing protein [Methanobacteriota archaeon]